VKPMIRTYRQLKKLRSFLERYDYLKLTGAVGESTFGYDRYLNQKLYLSKRWKRTRDGIIIRDDGCDLGDEDHRIYDKIMVHHINAITIEDIEEDRDIIYDPENLICTSHNTHNAIHYGDVKLLPRLPIERSRHDTCPWK
jgi:hypothetical protein